MILGRKLQLWPESQHTFCDQILTHDRDSALHHMSVHYTLEITKLAIKLKI